MKLIKWIKKLFIKKRRSNQLAIKIQVETRQARFALEKVRKSIENVESAMEDLGYSTQQTVQEFVDLNKELSKFKKLNEAD